MNVPPLARVSTRPALVRRPVSVLNLPAATAVSTMFFLAAVLVAGAGALLDEPAEAIPAPTTPIASTAASTATRRRDFQLLTFVSPFEMVMCRCFGHGAIRDHPGKTKGPLEAGPLRFRA